jgi:two-component system response regulator FlrC
MPRLSAGAEQRLMGHAWPGNVRELQQVIERAVILCEGNTTIGEEHICFANFYRARIRPKLSKNSQALEKSQDVAEF